ncbi:ROK family transcriptional regulator [Nitratireductor sp. ZSWI3]|uniref:ROK family transcriptional regulator n=1 Tax=Nitratireductor sp. ZSWI3 TaxID=2966359 RepID=UPI00214FAC7C|nr:ROK family transcriptional regulator [Nitratireductor sp. ZSWI3]MCR4265366.1 ROK family protein [Nitratireductor sp. ZSWI3]
MKITSPRRIVGSNAERSRLHNRQVVLGHVREQQPIGRAEIARISGLSTQAVSNIIAELEEDGFLLEAGRQTGGRGLPALQYRLNGDGAAALGIEVRPDAMFGALVNLEGETLFTTREALADNAPVTVASMARRIRAAALETRPAGQRMLGAGVVMPGPFGNVGISGAGQSALQGWEDTDAAALFEEALEMGVIIENDATAAAVAERVRGVAAGLRTFCFIYFGAGLGLGMVADGEVQRGAFGNAGEVGHVVVRPGGRQCACGNRGCLETYASRIAARARLAEAGIALTSTDDIDCLYRDRNPALMAWLDEAAEPLSQAIGMIENLFDPETVILGGAMPDAVLDHLISGLALPGGSVAVRPDRQTPRILRGACGRLTAALGGAALVIHDTITPRIAAKT